MKPKTMKPNLSPLMVGIVALVSFTLSFTVIQTFIPYVVASAQAMPSGPDFSRLSLSAEQETQIRNIQLEMKPQVMEVLTPNQQEQLKANLGKGQTLWQSLASLDLSKTQQSKVSEIEDSQNFNPRTAITTEAQYVRTSSFLAKQLNQSRKS
jgi:phosphotransferase system IIB component